MSSMADFPDEDGASTSKKDGDAEEELSKGGAASFEEDEEVLETGYEKAEPKGNPPAESDADDDADLARALALSREAAPEPPVSAANLTSCC